MQSVISTVKAIADQNRLTILYLLNQKSLCVCDLQSLMPLTQGALSTQLKNLSTVGLLSSTKKGKWVFYRLNKDIPKSYKTILTKLFAEIENDPLIICAMKNLKKISDCQNC